MKSIADSVKEFSGVEPPLEDTESAEDKAARAKEKEDARRQLIALQSLQGHEGWQLFKTYIDQQYEFAVDHVLRETEATKLHRSAGASFALRATKDWLDNQLLGLTEMLKS